MKNALLATTLVLLPLVALHARGEIPVLEWELIHGGPELDLANGVRQTSDGGSIVAGRRMTNGDVDFLLLRLDREGGVLWERSFGGAGEDLARAAEETADLGFIGVGGIGGRVSLVRTDALGEPLWQRSHVRGIGYSVMETADGGFIVTGHGGGALILLRTDSSGEAEWVRELGGAASDTGASVKELDDGYVVAGFTASFGPPGGSNAYMVRTDREGRPLWDVWFGGPGNDWFEGVVVMPDGDLVATGSSDGQFYLARVDSGGDEVWQRWLGGFESNALWPLADGGFVLGGLRVSDRGGENEARVVRTDADGMLVWSRELGRPDGVNWVSAIQQTDDGGFVVAGSTRSRDDPFFEIYVARLGPEGAGGAPFIRGDSNRDGRVDLSDASNTLGWLFLGAASLPCDDAADANDDASIGLSDAVFTLNFLFLGAGAPPPPFDIAGEDPTPDDLGCGR